MSGESLLGRDTTFEQQYSQNVTETSRERPKSVPAQGSKRAKDFFIVFFSIFKTLCFFGPWARTNLGRSRLVSITFCESIVIPKTTKLPIFEKKPKLLFISTKSDSVEKPKRRSSEFSKRFFQAENFPKVKRNHPLNECVSVGASWSETRLL